MSDVWRSVPKKFCNLCKCWFYDNKVSIEHHERGVRHQENVKNKIRDVGKKGKEREHENFEARKALAIMEREALKSYKEDVKSQPEVAQSYNIHLNLAALPIKGSKFTAVPSGSTIQKQQQPHLQIKRGVSTVWRELLDEQTQLSYYWNSETNETKWDQPKEGFLSIAEQEIADHLEEYGNTSELVEENSHDDPKIDSALDLESEKDGTGTIIVNTDEPGPSSAKIKQKDDAVVEQKQISPKEADETAGKVVTKPNAPFGKWTAVEEAPKK